jgi:hypothetical protein
MTMASRSYDSLLVALDGPDLLHALALMPVVTD